MKQITEKAEKRGRILYIIEAALEFFIAKMVAGSFLATLTKELGFSDSLTGILSSIISLGCLFQLISILIRPKRTKGFVIALSIINQLLFMFLYIIPLLNFSAVIKTVLFVAGIIVAYMIYYIAHPNKISWMMSMVDDSMRGGFTAKKEIISLVSGMGFSFAMGAVTDYFKENGNIKGAFIVSAITIFVIMLMHTLSMVFTPEKNVTDKRSRDLWSNIKTTFCNKNIVMIMGVYIIYYIAKGFCIPFYGSYAINELGLNLKLIATVGMLGSVSRIIASPFMGKYADKKSFAAMIEICFIFLAVSFAFMALPAKGIEKILYILYHIIHGISQAGINSALMNLAFDYVPREKRSDTLAVCQAVAGLVGFLTTLFASFIIASVQKNGCQIFGVNIYAQQLTTVVGVLVSVLAIFYVKYIVIRKTKKIKE